MEAADIQTSIFGCCQKNIAQFYCKSINCEISWENAFLCGDHKCYCYKQHKDCPRSLRQEVENLKLLISTFKRIRQHSDFERSLDKVVSRYRSLSVQILEDYMKLGFLQGRFAREKKEMKAIIQKLKGGGRDGQMKLSSFQILRIQSLVLVLTNYQEGRKQALSRLQAPQNQLSQALASMRSEWEFLNELYRIDASDNHLLHLQPSFGISPNENIPLIGIISNLVKPDAQRQIEEEQMRWQTTEIGKALRAANLSCILQKYRHVESLDLRDSLMADPQTKALYKCRDSLTVLNINENRISWKGIADICRNCSKLEVLQCQKNQKTSLQNGRTGANDSSKIQVGKNAMKSIAGLPCLQTLNISQNNLGGKMIEYLVKGRLSQLTTLNLSLNPIGDQGGMLVGLHLPQLKSLDIRGCRVGDPGITAIATGIRSLETLKIGKVHEQAEHNFVTDEGIQVLCSSQRSLKSLDVNGLNSISHKAFIAISGLLGELTQLQFDYEKTTRTALTYISKLRKLAGSKSLRLDNRRKQDGLLRISRNARGYGIHLWFYNSSYCRDFRVRNIRLLQQLKEAK